MVREAGVEVIEFSPADAKWFVDLAYSEAWNHLNSLSPVHGPKLKELLGQ